MRYCGVRGSNNVCTCGFDGGRVLQGEWIVMSDDQRDERSSKVTSEGGRPVVIPPQASDGPFSELR